MWQFMKGVMCELFDGKKHCSKIEYINDNCKAYIGFALVTDFISNILIFKK